MHVRSFLGETLHSNFNSKDTLHVSHVGLYMGPTGKPGICPEWTYVEWNTGYKGYTSLFFMKILRAGLDARSLERL
jgi:hypothetical protein